MAEGEYWLFGVHAVEAALRNRARRVRRLLATSNAWPRIEAAHERQRHPAVESVDPKRLEKLLPPGAVHQGIAALAEPLHAPELDEVLAEASRPLLLLDQVTDPHNVGAILRSAAAFDAAAVITTERHAPAAGAIMAKAASGALDIVPLVSVTNLAQAMERIKQAGYWIAGLDGQAEQTLPQAKLGLKTALVLGAEGKGMRRLTAERCDLLVRLPISPRMESLNVSNAAAVALYILQCSSDGV